MHLSEQLHTTAQLASPDSWTVLQTHLPESWIEQALAATGVTTLRRRRLPMEQALWLVLGIALMRDRSIAHVADCLGLALPGASAYVAPSALSQARQRLGAEPLAWLFRTTAARWAHAQSANHRWRGLGLYAVDGVVWRTPDTPENRESFGGQSNHAEHQSPYPQVRMACLMGARSRLLLDAAFDAYHTSEYALAEQLWPQLPADSLVLIDKGFYSAALLCSLQHHPRRHWLIPARANARGEVIATYGQGDHLLRMKVSPQARKRQPELPKTWEVRAITRPMPDGGERTVFTSLYEPACWPADEVFALYRERWEIELAYDEMKSELRHQAMTLRSLQAQGVRQELWAILLVYNLIRLEMAKIAEEAKVEPSRISFVTALRYIKDEWIWSANASPGTIPAKLRAMRENIRRFILPIRRTQRRYPRVVKMAPQFPQKKCHSVS